MKDTSQFIPLNFNGYILDDTPNDLLTLLKEEINTILIGNFTNTESFNKNLYSSIEKEISLCNTKVFELVEKHFCSKAGKFFEFHNNGEPNPRKFKLVSLWANFQKKGEYIPLHVHTDCAISFVIWVSLPYDIEKERNHLSVKNSNNFHETATSFVFVYPDFRSIGGVQATSLQLDKSSEGKNIMFWSDMRHMVYPFYTSDEYRISIAGNIGYC